MSTTRFQCDYAKRVSNCKKCKLQLPKGSLRLAKITPNPFVQDVEGPPPDMKQYFHSHCLFETFNRARATTKVIEEAGDIEGWSDMTSEDKDEVMKFIDDLAKLRGSKTPAKKTPAKGAKAAATATTSPKKDGSPDKKATESESTPVAKKAKTPAVAKDAKEIAKKEKPETPEVNEESKYNEFNKFCKLCEVIGSVSKYTEKSSAVSMLLSKDGFDGDVLTWIRLLLPIVDQRVYNIKEKQIIKHFSSLYDLNHDDLLNEYKNDGDVSITIRNALEKGGFCKTGKSDWSIQKVDRWLSKLAEFTKDEEQMSHLKFAAKRLSGLELMYLLRLVKKDLRFNAGVKHILDGLHPSAYEAFQNCRDLADIIERVRTGKLENSSGAIEVGIRLGTPVLPMLAEPCKTVEQAMRRCPNGMFSEIKYDGERVQVHKNGTTYSYFSRSLKPVQHHKISQFEEHIPKAFAKGVDLILDAEVLMVDTATGKPLPFGTLGIHKKEKFKDAAVCLFVFDILKYNDTDLTNTPLCDRKKHLEENMTEVKNHVMMSNYQRIAHGDNDKLKTMIWKAIDEGLEGLVMKDTKGVYEPGKRHWLKVKKDYLEEGKMADTADLIVLGAYFGTGSKGGMMSVFLMGVFDADTGSYRTVTKCGNGHTDDELEKINKQLKNKMRRIDRDFDSLPSWLRCSRALAPDFVMDDPKEAPVWEITGAEFSKSDNHTAGGISIRFPRVTRVRNDKDWQSATNLDELKNLYNTSKEKSDVDRTVEDEIPLYAKDLDNIMDTTEKPAGDGETDEKEEKRSKKRRPTDSSDSTVGPSSFKKAKASEDVVADNGAKAEEEAADEEKTGEEDSGEKCPDGATPCKYGSTCFRKNVDHLSKFWHPKTKK